MSVGFEDGLAWLGCYTAVYGAPVAACHIIKAHHQKPMLPRLAVHVTSITMHVRPHLASRLVKVRLYHYFTNFLPGA